MELRKIRDDEKKQVKELRKYSFSDWSNIEITDYETSDVIPEQSFGVFEGNRLVSLVRYYNLKQCIRGVIKDMCGVASIGTYPDCRNKGYVRSLMNASFEYMREKKHSVSMLMPFKDSFYANYGYVNANDKMFVKIPLTSFAHYIEKKSSFQWSYGMIKATEGKNTYISFAKEMIQSIHGFTLFEDICDEEWNRASKDEIIVLVKKQGIPEAIARYKKKGFIETGEIFVSEMLWKNLDARDKLFEFFARHIDQIVNIMLPIPRGTNVYQWTMNAMKSFEAIMYHNTWMVRVIDIEKAISDLSAGDNYGEFIIEITDSQCEWNNGIFKVWSSDSRKLKIERVQDNPTVKADIKGITALIYGSLPVEEIEHRKWINIQDKKSRDTIEKWFYPIPIYVSHDYRTTIL